MSVPPIVDHAAEPDLGLTDVSSVRDLAKCLDVRYSTLIYFANAGRVSAYKSFEIRKRSGSVRQIDSPVDLLKHIQRRLVEKLTAIYCAPNPVHGFVPGRSIVSNATPHAGRRWVLNIDLKDFFPSINFGRVRGVLKAAPYGLPLNVATVVARLCCHRNSLPQGAPSSPILSNMVARSLDTKLRELARKHHVTYTRYADDITFSGHSRTIPSSLASSEGGSYRCGEGLRALITSCGFALNEEKFRVQVGGMRKIATGLVVNDHVNVRRRFVREIRGMLHAWRAHGYDAANREYAVRHWNASTGRQTQPPDFRRVLRGRLEYLHHIKGETDLVFGLFKQLADLDTTPSLHRRLAAMEARRAKVASRLDRAVFVLEDESTGDQGTGFLVADVGIVTCAHVLSVNTEAFRILDPSKRYSLKVKHIDRNRDVAVLDFTDHVPDPSDYLRPAGPAELALGTLVTLAGFANFAPGASLNIKTAQISQRRRWFDHHRFNVNTGIISGMSGGPVLNTSGEVLGIAVTGASSANRVDDPEAEHGVIPWMEIVASLTSSGLLQTP